MFVLEPEIVAKEKRKKKHFSILIYGLPSLIPVQQCNKNMLVKQLWSLQFRLNINLKLFNT